MKYISGVCQGCDVYRMVCAKCQYEYNTKLTELTQILSKLKNKYGDLMTLSVTYELVMMRRNALSRYGNVIYSCKYPFDYGIKSKGEISNGKCNLCTVSKKLNDINENGGSYDFTELDKQRLELLKEKIGTSDSNETTGVKVECDKCKEAKGMLLIALHSSLNLHNEVNTQDEVGRVVIRQIEIAIKTLEEGGYERFFNIYGEAWLDTIRCYHNYVRGGCI